MYQYTTFVLLSRNGWLQREWSPCTPADILQIHKILTLCDQLPDVGGTLGEDQTCKDLAQVIMDAWKEQLNLLVEEHFPDGKFYLTYMYFVVKRKPRM